MIENNYHFIESDINFDEWKGKDDVGIAVTSGGMDSTSMGLAMLKEGKSVIFCHITLGQKSLHGEKWAVRHIVSNLKDRGYDVGKFIVELPWLGELGGSSLTQQNIKIPKGMDSLLESANIASNLDNPGLWTPGRNIVLLSVAASLADRIHANTLTLGANQSEVGYRDNTMDFLKSFELMSRFGTLVMPEVTAPLYNLDKAEILKWAIDNDFYGVYEHTWSCDNHYRTMCGECGCCNNRQLAFFILNNIFKYDYPDNQAYRNPAYFKAVFLKEAIDRRVPGIWYEKYIKDIEEYYER